MKIEAKLVKAFTKDKTQGNPAGVVLHADSLSSEHMQAITAELGFSESAFVQSSTIADLKVRFFTPTQEVVLCGHATIATFHTLVENGTIRITGKYIQRTQQTKAGILPVTCYADGHIMMTQAQATYIQQDIDRNTIAPLLGISVTDFMDWPMCIVSTGTPKLLIPIKTLATLFAIIPDLDGIKEFCRKTGAKGFYPFTTEVKEKDSDFHARQFNPLAGVNEDPITGVAAGALGAYIQRYNLSEKKHFIIEQGYIMHKAGTIIVELGEHIQVGGYAVTYDTKAIELIENPCS